MLGFVLAHWGKSLVRNLIWCLAKKKRGFAFRYCLDSIIKFPSLHPYVVVFAVALQGGMSEYLQVQIFSSVFYPLGKNLYPNLVLKRNHMKLITAAVLGN